MISGKKLSEFYKYLLDADVRYCMGGWGFRLTEAQYAYMGTTSYYRRYPDRYEKLKAALGKIVVDCYGGKKYLTWMGENGDPPIYEKNGILDCNTETAFQRARVKGKISDLPDRPGIFLYRYGHVGVYHGDGTFTEVYSSGKPPRTKRIEASDDWTDWFEDTDINYTDTVIPEPGIKVVEFKTCTPPTLTIWRRKTPVMLGDSNTIDILKDGQPFAAIGITKDNWIQIASGGWVESVYANQITAGELTLVSWQPSKAVWEVGRILKFVPGAMMRGKDVESLQEAITKIDIDGIFGEQTKAALENRQTQLGLVADGKAGRLTVTAMGGRWTGV